jgi:restriction system protein
MAYPKQHAIEVPLLKAIRDLGGEVKPKQVYPIVAQAFPDLTEDDLSEKLPSSPSTFKWHNLVQWARQSLVEKHQIDGSTRGIWAITDAGISRLSGADSSTPADTPSDLFPAPASTLKDLVYENEEQVKDRILTELKGLTPTGFEHFCLTLLQELGYDEIAVTGRGADKGIDGYGNFRQGVVTIKSAFQAKRWMENPVSRPEIDKFRGAIQGDFDHGVFLTTSRFTKDAEAASVKKGAITILLLDGEAIATQMIRKGLGVTKTPLFLFDVDSDFFDFDSDDALL